MEQTLYTLDWILYALFAVNVLYLFTYSLASYFRKPVQPEAVKEYKRIAILIPAYREDGVIHECVQSCLAQTYPSHCFDTVVISDQMQPETNASLAALPIRLVEVHFEQSTKSKSLNHAMAAIGNEYDIALVLDADNVIPATYLQDVNNYFFIPGVEIIQTHRVAKNLNSHIALLDAVSEEINNTIFRLGHANLGLSAALIGSGMAFRYDLFRDTMLTIHAVGGFDRALELTLLYQGKRVHYLPHTYVQDEKIQTQSGFSRQRRRWISAQLHYFNVFSGHFFTALRSGKWDFCDKFYQQLSIPRLLLIGFIFLSALLCTFLRAEGCVRWWMLFAWLVVTLLMAVPRHYYTRRLLAALVMLPYTFYLMAVNLFKLKGANKKFIHTAHGVENK